MLIPESECEGKTAAIVLFTHHWNSSFVSIHDLSWQRQTDLTLIDVSAATNSLVSSVEWEDQFQLDGITVPALVTVRFQQGIFESMNDEHLIDLHFAYTPPETTNKRDVLYVNPQWGFGNIQLDPHWLEAFGFEDHEQLEKTPTTTGIVSVAPRKFLRGDANSSYSIEVEDALTILKATFYSGIVDIQCQRAADSNNDGKIGISDSVQLLTYLYAGGAPPEAPFPFIDVDHSNSPLSCETYGPPSFELVR